MKVNHQYLVFGTGSNSCFYDGKNIREEVPAIAYVLGDEGSGSYGKKLLKITFTINFQFH